MSRVEQRRPVQRRGGGLLSGVDLKEGALFGAGAWVVGFVLTGLLAFVEFNDERQEIAEAGEFDQLAANAESLPSATDFVGWLFYNVHFVDVGFEVNVMGMGGGIWMNFVTGSVNLTGLFAEEAGGAADIEQDLGELFSTVPTPVWLLVPVVVLVAAGYFVASRSGAYDTTSGAKSGASVAIGYVVLAFVGTSVFAWSPPAGDMGMSLSLGPQTTMAVALMGVVYPAVFGGIGGILAVKNGDQQPLRRAAPVQQPPGTPQTGYQQPPQDHQQPPGQHAPQGQQAPQGQHGGYQQGAGQPQGGHQHDQQSGHQHGQQSAGEHAPDGEADDES